MILKHSYVSTRSLRKQGLSYKAATKAAVGSMIAHVKYLQHRPGEDKEKGGRKFYDEFGQEIDGSEVRKEIRKLGSKSVVIHRLLLAPDVNPHDPIAYAQEVMHGIEAEKGQDLVWRMVTHKNTAHHHVNVICYGKDKNGREVRFSKKDYARMRELGDDWLDRNHPVEREEKRREREERKQAGRERRAHELEKARIARQAYNRRHYIDAWKYEAMHQIYPDSPRRNSDRPVDRPEKITVDGVTYTKETSLEDLNKLDDFLWENKIDLPKQEARELRRWIFRQERLLDRPQRYGEEKKKKSEFDPEQYAQTVLRRQAQDLSKNQRYGQKGDPVGGRWTDPLQEAVTSSPGFSLFQKTAGLANELVKSIQLLDTRDFNKLAQEELDERMRELEEVWKRLKGTEYQARIEESMETIQKAKKQLEEGKKQQIKERERSRRRDDPDSELMG